MSETETTFRVRGRLWRVVADYPQGSAFDKNPYLCAVPWDGRRKRWQTSRSVCIFERDVLDEKDTA